MLLAAEGELGAGANPSAPAAQDNL
jgi:hypothetical protein